MKADKKLRKKEDKKLGREAVKLKGAWKRESMWGRGGGERGDGEQTKVREGRTRKTEEGKKDKKRRGSRGIRRMKKSMTPA